MTTIRYRSVDVDGQTIAYREAGEENVPKLLLLHGYPSAGHMFRDLIPLLAPYFHMIAPDLPGFGKSGMPKGPNTFDFMAEAIDRFTDKVGFDRYALYVFDYGAPTGFRLAVKHPDRITAIISQNGNAYLDGLGDAWNPVRAYWENPSQANRDNLRDFLKSNATYFQYSHGVPDPQLLSPDGYSLDDYYLQRPGMAEVQLDLFLDYRNNLALYPKFQEYFRTHKPIFLAAWGKNDPFFVPPGAEPFKRDNPNAVVEFYDTDHFALETHAREIADAIVGSPSQGSAEQWLSHKGRECHGFDCQNPDRSSRSGRRRVVSERAAVDACEIERGRSPDRVGKHARQQALHELYGVSFWVLRAG